MRVRQEMIITNVITSAPKKNGQSFPSKPNRLPAIAGPATRPSVVAERVTPRIPPCSSSPVCSDVRLVSAGDIIEKPYTAIAKAMIKKGND